MSLFDLNSIGLIKPQILRNQSPARLYEDAIRYLRKEAVNLPADTPKGYVLVTYQQMPLGWEKNIGNRANNLYPQEWKIKSSHVPEEPCVISKK